MATGQPQDEQDRDSGDDQPDPRPSWSPSAQIAAAVLWPSFLAASLATMLFFAFVDPEVFRDLLSPAFDLDRMTGYAIGFLFFWFMTALSSGVSVYLLRTGPRHPEQGQDRRP